MVKPGAWWLAIAVTLSLMTITDAGDAGAQQFGRFSSTITLELLADGRSMKVARPFTYIGADKVEWLVPAGAVTNGATIPSALWSVVGGPWEGKYRDASVVHDHFCTTKLRPAKQTHRMFYDASRARGVSKTVADLMYAAILTWDRQCGEPKGLAFGDGEAAEAKPDGRPSSTAPAPAPVQAERSPLSPNVTDPATRRRQLRALKKQLEQRNYTPEEIEDLVQAPG